MDIFDVIYSEEIPHQRVQTIREAYSRVKDKILDCVRHAPSCA